MARKCDVESTGVKGVKRRLKDGKYLVTLDLGREAIRDNETGQVKLRQIKTTKVVSSMKEAKHLIAEVNREKQAKKSASGKGVSRFDKAIDAFLTANKEDWDQNYYYLQNNNAKRLKAFFGTQDIHKIEPLDVEQFYKWCRTGNREFGALSETSILELKSTLNQLYQWQMKAGNVESNPVNFAVPIQRDKYDAKTLDENLLGGLLAFSLQGGTCDTCKAVVIALAAFCGLRRGEVCGLQWGKIDWENHRIRIDTQRKQARDGSVIISVPKNGKEEGTAEERKERWAAMPPQAEYVLRLAKKQQALYGEAKDTDYVYRRKENVLNGYPPVPKNLDVDFAGLKKAFAKTHDFPNDFRYHDMRHTFITLCLNGGVNLFQVSASVGHSMKASGTTSVRVYWHDDGMRAEINQFLGDKVPFQIDKKAVEKSVLGTFR